MCKLNNNIALDYPRSGLNPTEQALVAGEPGRMQKGNHLNNISDEPMEVTCLHDDGRTDTYTLQPGQSLELDEDAAITINNAEAIASKLKEAHNRKHNREQ